MSAACIHRMQTRSPLLLIRMLFRHNRLAVLFIKTLNLQHRAAWSFLNKHCAGMATPAFFSKLKDEGACVVLSSGLRS